MNADLNLSPSLIYSVDVPICDVHDGHFDIAEGGLEIASDFSRAHLRKDLPDALNTLFDRLLLILSLLASILQEVINHLV